MSKLSTRKTPEVVSQPLKAPLKLNLDHFQTIPISASFLFSKSTSEFPKQSQQNDLLTVLVTYMVSHRVSRSTLNLQLVTAQGHSHRKEVDAARRDQTVAPTQIVLYDPHLAS